MRKRLPSLVYRASLLFVALIVSLSLGCRQDDAGRGEPLTLAVPWPDQEEARYILYEAEREIARGVLRVSRVGDAYHLEQQFSAGANSDQSLVVADPASLKPRSSRRIITGENPQTVRAAYSDGGVTITTNSGGRMQERALQLPANAYDNDSSLFLWRALPFADEYRARYVSVVTLNASRPAVALRVVRRETIEVPAGRFEVWRLEITAGRVRQTAWYTTDARRHLVRYDNGRLVFVLERFPASG